eukprot:PhM_4_TR11197/c0_g1_i1/m.64148/K09568/FKBP1; FK506-binding protein 1
MPVTIEKIIEGDGKTYPKKGQLVSVHYTGYLNDKDNTEFDSTHRRGKPFKFRLQCGEVIKGWDEGVAQMSLGERAKITMPPDMAYSDAGIPGLIPRLMPITFDVELLEFT